MLPGTQKLTINAEDYAVIESALQTQMKIFNVQASAGNREAGARLNDIKRTLAGLAQQKPAKPVQARPGAWRWFNFSRSCG